MLEQKPVMDEGREKFNPLIEIFDEPEKGSGMEGEVDSLANGTLHTEYMFDEESESGAGEKVNPVTGRPYENKQEEETVGLTDLDAEEIKKYKDPAEMSLEELIASQKEDN